MDNIPVKNAYDGVSSPVADTEVHTAAEYNDRREELQKTVTDAGQTLAAVDTGQLSKAMFANGVSAQSMIDSGATNSITLTPITGASGLRVATPIIADYSLLDGAIFTFKVNQTNTGNVTVNVGQTTGALIGALSLFLEDGTTNVPAGTLIIGNYYSVLYTSGGGGIFILLSMGTGSGQRITSVASPTDSQDAVNKSYADFGSWTDRDSLGNLFVNTGIYQATSDGFIICGEQGHIKLYTDGSNPPTTLRWRHDQDGSGDTTTQGFLPIKSGDYWVANGWTHFCYWLPIGSGVCIKQ